MKRCLIRPFLSSQRFIEDLTGKNLFYQGPVSFSFILWTGPWSREEILPIRVFFYPAEYKLVGRDKDTDEEEIEPAKGNSK